MRFVVLLIAFLLSGCVTVGYYPFDGHYKVSRVIDGDTFDVDFDMNGVIDRSDERCRLVGCDTPETSGRRGVQFMGPEAAIFVRESIEKQLVLLEFQRPRRDSFGRVLMRVRLGDGTYLNEQLIKLGLARAWTADWYPEKDNFLKLETIARENKIGMWVER